MAVGRFVLEGGTGFCNAVRRSLLSDTKAEAPCEVDITKNTSYQTDEFIAHRIGLIPFRRIGNGDTLSLNVSDRTPLTDDFTSLAFEPTHSKIEIIKLLPGQSLELTVRIDERAAREHARYCMCAAVGMQKVDGDGRHVITFETINDRDPKSVMQEALEYLDARVDDALKELARRDVSPPRTMC